MSRLDILKDRAKMLSLARSFFASHEIIEVDCPLLTKHPSIDAHIDLIPSLYSNEETRYLHSSPEYGMKRLLAEGIGDCYQLAHVFRDGECGRKHNPEFMLAEWYRVGMSFPAFIDETLNFIRLLLGPLEQNFLTYREAFEKYLNINPFQASLPELQRKIEELNLSTYDSIELEGKDAYLNLLLSYAIEPHLGENALTVLAYYPSSQAALAMMDTINQDQVACRFEVYYRGLELANGYLELVDAKEQRKRLIEANQLRLQLHKPVYPLDEIFLEALKTGLPSCCGVAVGFDRLMMLRHETSHLSDVLSFDWANA